MRHIAVWLHLCFKGGRLELLRVLPWGGWMYSCMVISGSKMFISGMKCFSRLVLAGGLRFGLYEVRKRPVCNVGCELCWKGLAVLCEGPRIALWSCDIFICRLWGWILQLIKPQYRLFWVLIYFDNTLLDRSDDWENMIVVAEEGVKEIEKPYTKLVQSSYV